MKRIIISCLISLFILTDYISVGQSTFEYISAKVDTDQCVADAISKPNGEVIFVGTSKVGGKFEGNIFILGSDGELLSHREFAWHGKSTYIEKIAPVSPNRFLLIGAVTEGVVYNLFVCLIDSALNEIKGREFPLGSYNYLSSKSLTDHDHNIIINGLVSDTTTFDRLYPYLYKISTDLDSIQLKIFDKQAWGIFDMMEKSNHDGYYLFLNANFGLKYNGSTVLVLDDTFNVVQTEHIPSDVENYNTAKWITDSTFILSGEHFDLDVDGKVTLGVVVVDTSMNEKYFTHFGKDTITNFPGFRRNLDFITPAQIYLGGTTNLGYDGLFMNQDSWFFLNKFDSTLALTWQKSYSKSGYYYNLWGILATQDGGCIMYGTRYNYPTNSMTRDIYILKVDKQGFALSTDDYDMMPPKLANIYPNPGQDDLCIQTSLKNADFVLADCLGREIFRKPLLSNTTVLSTNKLESGLYLYSILQFGSVVQTGKWIKY
ncbi:MAG: T9SS type A sorting domain-containing protein [Bacteroidales bacterium]|jgi:glucan-binding YG repeat protein|nr:T9SS type A sorting domain-containing protein [Bacteroidales bacterium]MDD4604504.1 T9SS type A sorting domain-containing protein [Bacteroidales bacterium]